MGGLRVKKVLFMLTILMSFSGISLATPTTWYFEGTIDSVDSNLSAYFSTGELFSSVITFEPTVDIDPDPDEGAYFIESTVTTFGSYNFSANVPTAGSVQLRNGVGSDTLSAGYAYHPYPFYLPSSAWALLSTGISLTDIEGTALSSQSIPASLPSLSLFEANSFTLHFETPAWISAWVSGTVTSMSTTANVPGVPEPTTMLLFGTGIAGLAAVGRRRKK